MKKKNNEFIISFKFELTSDNGFKLIFTHNFFLNAMNQLQKSFTVTLHISERSQAIAYPYVRAFVATLLFKRRLRVCFYCLVNFVEHVKS